MVHMVYVDSTDMLHMAPALRFKSSAKHTTGGMFWLVLKTSSPALQMICSIRVVEGSKASKLGDYVFWRLPRYSSSGQSFCFWGPVFVGSCKFFVSSVVVAAPPRPRNKANSE